MKRKSVSLSYRSVSLSPNRRQSDRSATRSSLPDISGYDGRYGFSCSWTWKHIIDAPENWDGKPISVSFSVSADDNATLSVGGTSISSSYSRDVGGPVPASGMALLNPGIYEVSLSYLNIDYKPPSGNVASLSWSVSSGRAGTLIPEKNDPPPPSLCDCDDSDKGGSEPTVQSARSRVFSAFSGAHSSAGRNARLSVDADCFCWQSDFGKFRGLGGIASGRLEILAYAFSETLASPDFLEFRHPLNSWLVFPNEGISAGTQLKVFTGGAYTSWVCDGNGNQFFPIGTSSKVSEILRWATAEKTSLELVFPDKSVIKFSAEDGEILSYKTPRGRLWTASELASFLEILRDENGVLRQIWNFWDGLAAVENISASGYEIAFYLPNQVGEKIAETGLYSVSGTAFKRFIVSLSSSGKLTIAEQDSRAGAQAFPRSVWFENGAWNSSIGDGSEEIFTRRQKTTLEGNRFRIVTTVSRASESVPASLVAEEFEYDEALGNLCLSRTEAYESALAATTLFDYDGAGREIKETRPDGSVFETTYDIQGRVSVRYEPFAGARNKTTYFHYVSDENNVSDLSYTETRISRMSGPVNFSRTDFSRETFSDYEREERRTGGIGFEGTRLEVTETWLGTCANEFARGRVKMVQAQTGVQTHYDYAGTTLHGALYKITEETRVAGTAVNGKSSRRVSYVSTDGNTVFEEKFVLDNAGTWQKISEFSAEFDAFNNESKRTRGNGRVFQRETMCCGPLWEIDEDGVRTDYVYSSARLLTEKTRALTAQNPERCTIYEHDARGNVVHETLKLNSVDFSEKTTAFDLLGRKISETDALGRTTLFSYSQSNASTTETQTLPDGATRITTTHADGTVLSESGTSRRAVASQIDFVSDGMRLTRRIAGTTNNAGVLSREIRNGFGEIIRETKQNISGAFVATESVYNARSLPIRRVAGTAAPELFEYDDFGNEIKYTLALAQTPNPQNSRVRERSTFFENRDDGVYRVITETTYNAAGTPLVRSTATLVSESAVFENKTVETDIRGNATVRQTEFGEPGERLQKTQIAGTTNIAQSRTLDGFTVSQTDHAGTLTQFARTFKTGANAGVVLTTTDGRGNAASVEQNVLGQTLKTTDAAGNVLTTVYDAAGRVSQITDALGKTRCFAYDSHGNAVAEFGTGTQAVARVFDDANNLVSQKLFRVPGETIETDPRTRADGDETRWEYHAAIGLLLKKIYPDGNELNYNYDSQNRLAGTVYSREVSAGTPLTVSRAYNEKTGELTQIAYNDGTSEENFVYNFLGQLTQISDASGTREIVYNAYGETESETLTGDNRTHAVAELRDAFGRGIGYTYSKAGSLQQTTNIVYDEGTGRISNAGFLHGGNAKNFGFGYLPGTNLIENITMPNNMSLTQGYEANRDLVASMQYKRNTTSVVERHYTYDELGRPATRQTARNGEVYTDSFAYNSRSELTEATIHGRNYTYSYDNIGNRKEFYETGWTFDYETNAQNQYTRIVKQLENNEFVPEYDADGNATLIKTEADTWRITYNGANRPVRFENEGTNTVVEMGYDYLGRRFFKKVTVSGTVTLHQRYIYRGFLQIAAVDLTRGGHPALWFVTWDPTQQTGTRPLAIQKNGSWFAYGWDITKNVCEVFGPSGYIRESYSYTPFGKIYSTGDVNQPFRWSSEYYDAELDLIYYNYRHYSPTLGRWLSRDPIEEQGGLNLYAFCKNNSVSQWDNLGNVVPIAVGGVIIPISAIEAAALAMGLGISACLENITCRELALAYMKEAIDAIAVQLKISLCEAAYWEYKSPNCAKCTQNTTLTHNTFNCACWGHVYFWRKSYIKMKCDYFLLGSIRKGSKIAEDGHLKELKNVENAMNKCCNKICCDEKNT